ncbi:hypothetical protein C9439_03730 [archaeon SCG-AAA382B04]|nr:hypothetical protein C9439_03730 [archaeon SCG-AAA382B04]
MEQFSGYREGDKSFGDVREMSKKAKKFDEMRDTIMKELPSDIKKEVRKRLGEDGGGGRSP